MHCSTQFASVLKNLRKKIQLVQVLHEDDFYRRDEFCEIMLDRYNNDHQHSQHIILYEEDMFYLNKSFIRQTADTGHLKPTLDDGSGLAISPKCQRVVRNRGHFSDRTVLYWRFVKWSKLLGITAINDNTRSGGSTSKWLRISS